MLLPRFLAIIVRRADTSHFISSSETDSAKCVFCCAPWVTAGNRTRPKRSDTLEKLVAYAVPVAGSIATTDSTAMDSMSE